jgi:hypothetical protein
VGESIRAKALKAMRRTSKVVRKGSPTAALERMLNRGKSKTRARQL